MDVRVDPAGGENLALAGDDFGARSDDDVDTGLDVRIARLADARDPAADDRDVGFDDAPMVDDERVGDDGVGGTLRARHLRLAHAVADHLAAAEFYLLAVDRQVALHHGPEIGVGKAHAVAGGGAEHVGVGTAGDSRHLERTLYVAAKAPDDVRDPRNGIST